MREWVHGAEGTDSAKPGVNGLSLQAKKKGTGNRVIVVHCKAGKGRSGSMAVSYLVSQEGWTKVDALARFTERRMRPGFGSGVSIPSQLRWLGYVERWANNGKIYLERTVEVKEVHIWGLREGVKVGIEGFVEEGRKIKTFHVFNRDERDDIGEATIPPSPDDTVDEKANLSIRNADGTTDSEASSNKGDRGRKSQDDTPSIFSVVSEVVKAQRRTLSLRRNDSKRSSRQSSRMSSTTPSSRTPSTIPSPTMSSPRITQSPDPIPLHDGAFPEVANSGPPKGATASSTSSNSSQVKTTNTVFRPTDSVILPTSDVNISFERRAHASYGWAMVTSVAHVWFNVFFEGRGPERIKERDEAKRRRGASTDRLSDRVPQGPEESGVFEVTWEQLDGIKGSARKGTRALDKVQVVWHVRADVKPNISPVPSPAQQMSREAAPLAQANEEVDLGDIEREDSQESFGSAKSNQDVKEDVQGGVLIRQPTRPGDVQESKPANWEGSGVRQAETVGEELMARRLGPRKQGDGAAARAANDAQSKRDRSAGEEQPELDDSSDEDSTAGIRRGVRLSVSDGSDGKSKKRLSKV